MSQPSQPSQQGQPSQVRRLGAVIALREEDAEEYVALHRDVPEEVLETLRRANMRNYSIFRWGELLFAYLEYAGGDLAADNAMIAADPATQRWWSVVMPMQRTLRTSPEGDWWTPMDEVFRLD
jgi:L-rhamnose mutarotase